MRISDLSSDVCSSDLPHRRRDRRSVLKDRQMDIRPIRNDDDHRAAVDEIRALWSAEAGSADEDRLDVPATLVDEYERKRWPVDKLDPVEAIEAAMEAEGRTRADLASLIGQSRATEVLARKRGLTLHMIRKIEQIGRAACRERVCTQG